MLAKDCLIHIGKIIGTHGYKGQLRIKLTQNITSGLDIDSIIFFMLNDKPVPFFIEEPDLLNPELPIISFEGIDSKEEAQKYIKTEIFISKAMVDICNQHDLKQYQLTGYVVWDQNNVLIGEITNTFENFEQYTLEIKIKEKVILVPFHQDLLIDFDLKAKIIRMDIPDGLLNI